MGVESGMWALFAGEHQISRPFRSEQEAWHQARKCNLADGDQLEQGYEIRRIGDGEQAA